MTYLPSILAVSMLAAGAAAAQDADMDEGMALFQQNCRTCHVVTEGDNRLGPTLHGVMGRESGAVEDFDYSSSLGGGAFTWDEETLDGFLADPAGFAPGNRMLYPGMPDPDARAAVIAYLADQG